MKWTALILLSGLVQAHARGLAQGTITLSVKKAPLSTVFSKIQQQSGYAIWYDDALLEHTRPVDLDLKEATLTSAMEACCRNQPIGFSIHGKMVIIEARPASPAPTPPTIDVRGTVVNEKGEPLAGATITVRGTQRSAVSDNKGIFELKGMEGTETLLVTNVGYEGQEIALNYRKQLVVQLFLSISKLDEVQVIGYGTTTKRLSTGSVSRVTSEEIEKQPVTNPLSALSGRAAGVFVQTTNGLPGGNINIQIRGKGSIAAGTDPLFVVDGVPYPSILVPGLTTLANESINGAVNPLNSLNPADIESITVLKDADATAIYGSRGANGVVLIETKKGKAGTPRLSLNISEGINKIASQPQLMNLRDYLQIRREAFSNDGLVPSADPSSFAYAPDLLVWDTTKSTNWPKYLLGGTGNTTDFQGSHSGGNAFTNFILGGNYHTETTILPGDSRYSRGGFHLNFHHQSSDRKLTIDLANSLVGDKNTLPNPTTSLAAIMFLAPDYPMLNANGEPNWFQVNPAGALTARNKSNTDNLVTNLVLGYTLIPGVTIKTSLGFNRLSSTQVETNQRQSLYPGTMNYSIFGNNAKTSFVAEPQVFYTRQLKKAGMTILAGATWQSTNTRGEIIEAGNFSSERLMENLGSAAIINARSSLLTQYKYVSAYSRIGLNYDRKYLLNISGRRDGSSRFGPGNQFGNFGAIGAGWVFSREKWAGRLLPFISFGKLRGSLGITGNDQITDYQYLSTYYSPGDTYQDNAILKPSRVANGRFRWESNKKWEGALELGLFKDRILLTVSRYQQRSGNQLVAYTIPNLTGFSSYQANFPAEVDNSGWELEFVSQNFKGKGFTWSTNFNVSFPKNRLKSFQNLLGSSYANLLVIGEDITRFYGTWLTGLDSTGRAIYAPQPGSNTGDPWFYYTLGRSTPDYFGGLANNFTFRQWQLDVFFQFTHQISRGGITYTSGIPINNYKLMMDRWQRVGDKTSIPRAGLSSDFYYAYSSANIVDGSYLRVKNISIAYNFRGSALQRIGINSLKCYLQGQNLFAWWNNKASLFDPESGAISPLAANIPPMKSFLAGIQLTF